MKTTTQILTLATIAVLAVVGSAAPAVANHNHLGHASQAAAEVASHARHVQSEIRSARLPIHDHRDLSQDAAQLELSARRLQSYARIGNLALAQREAITARNLARHLSQHARDTRLGYSPGFRGELSEIFRGLNEVDRELAAQLDHFRPVPSRPFPQPGRPGIGFSVGNERFSINVR